jgi:glycine betaine/proline transport system permease protein
MDWLETYKIPMDDMSESIVDWLKANARPFFDTLSDTLEFMIDGIVWALQTPPALLIVLLFIGLTWVLQRSWKVCLLVACCLLFIINQGYWEETTDSLALVLSSCVVCMGIGVPIGIFLAHRPRAYQFVSPVLDLMQTLPIFFGLGMVPGLFATVIFVVPAPIRLTYLGVSNTPTELVEATEAFGATPRQLLWKVELPYAIPQIMAGLNQVIMLSLSMVVIAAYVGADGLGKPVVQALGRNDPGLGFESGFVIVAVAIMLDRMLRVKKA